MPDNLAHILMVDDDPEDVLLVKTALKRASLPVSFRAFSNGEDLLSVLNGQKDRDTFIDHCLILMDMNIPKMDGHMCLDILRNDLDFELLPVVIYSTSDAYEDVTKSYEKGANAHVCKPDDIGDLETLMTMLYRFWLLPLSNVN